MSGKICSDCGTRLDQRGVCENCDEAAFIMDHQSEYLPENGVSEAFLKEATEGWNRAAKRMKN